MEYFVIGEREIVLGFNMVGVEGCVCVTKNEVHDAFSRVTGLGEGVSLPVEQRPKILILTEQASSLIEDEVLQWQKIAKYPLIVEIPGIQGHLKGHKSLTDSIRDAIGIQI